MRNYQLFIESRVKYSQLNFINIEYLKQIYEYSIQK